MKYLNELDKDLYEALSVNNQLHLIRYLDELSAGERELLINDLKQIDFAEVNQFFARTVLNESKDATETSEGSMQPVPAANKGGYESSSPAELASYELDGLRAIAENKCAVILLAGGQGTRLGVSYPKGMYSVDLLSKKTLYQLQAERLIKVKQLADAKFNNSESSAAKSIPWYMMTSEATKELTREFFSQHGYFGLSEDSVVLFEQGMLPCLNKEGKIILDEKFKVSKAPDGNGGLYRALAKRGVLQDMAKRGVEYVQVYCVDNILVRMADPVFFGFCIQKNANCAAKVVKKTDPEEKVGVICKVEDKFQVVEYSEISPKCRNLRKGDSENEEDNELVFNAGNICNHFFRKDFLDTVCVEREKELKHHIAEKKIAFVDEESGLRVVPKEVNGIKLEKFVFDVFPFSDRFVTWEVSRHEEFAPLKNGYDAKKENPLTCRQNLYAQHYRWLKNAGATFDKQEDENNNSCGSQKVAFEISPLVSYNGEGLEDLVNGRTLPTSVLIEYDQSEKAAKITSSL